MSEGDLVDQAVALHIEKNVGHFSRPTVIRKVVADQVFDRYEREFSRARSELIASLSLVSAHDLNSFIRSNAYLGGPTAYRETNEARDFAAKVRFPQMPHWCHEGFETEEHKPDYLHWARLRNWNIQQQLSLSLGFDPIEYAGVVEALVHIDNELKTIFTQRFEVLNDHFGEQSGVSEMPSPETFRDWALRFKVDLPQELIDAVSDICGPTDCDKTKLPTEEKLDARERISFQKLVIGMAIGGYAYDPSKGRNDAVTDIQSDLDKLGISLDPKTIREHLKKASQLLPDDALRE